ncbi:Alpha/Beta hydrolase protein [Linnemannia elongata]|nr:Alpha/Beta hydrolase protein [Linnemannia elongata]
MVVLKQILSSAVALLATLQISFAAPAPTVVEKRSLSSSAPLASDINGAHLLLLNDVDSETSKNAFLLLSAPRGYYDGMSACSALGDGGYIYIPGTAGASNLVTLLNNNAVAQKEVSAFSQFWVYNGVPGVLSNCLAVNKNTGKTDWIPCSTQLPTVCFNSVLRRVLLFQDTSRQVKVTTPTGTIQGWRDQNAFRFLGIPYAEPPVGNLRFASPVAKAAFTGTFDALSYKGICPQTSQDAGFVPLLLSYLENGATEKEDCLNLNVYTPSLKGAGQELLPVMFYIHGGGFTTYSGSVIIFEPGNMVSRGGVVVVTINYRLGMLGWFENEAAWGRSEIQGNQALRDQILALQWVQKNIASFGGDPTRVTVFGESAGATSIRALLAAPVAFPLYQGVIGESDPINIPFKTPDDAASISTYFLQALNCTDVACARTRPVDQVLTAQTTANAKALADDKWTTWALVERPSIDGLLIKTEFSAMVKAGTYNTKANIMWGTVHDEAGLFVPHRTPRTPDAVRNLFTRAGTEFYFFCPLRYLSRQMTKRKPVYNFRFNRGRDTPLVGEGYCSASTGRVCHSADIQPVFASGAAVPTIKQTGDDARFARQVVDRFTTFAKTGNPNPQPGLQGVENQNPDVTGVNWKAYDDSNPVFELNVQSSMSSNLENAECTWIETVFKYSFWTEVPGNLP